MYEPIGKSLDTRVPAERCKECGKALPPKPAGAAGRRREFCAGVADRCKIKFHRRAQRAG